YVSIGSKIVKMYDMRSSKCIHEFHGHLKPVTHIQLDEAKIISGADDCVCIWDLRNRRCVESLNGLGSITGLRFDDEKLIISTKKRPSLHIYYYKTSLI